MRDRIGHHDPIESTSIQRIYRIATQDPVGYNGNYLRGTMIKAGFGGFDERTAGVGHVVNQDTDFRADVADKGHFGDLVGPGALFVDEGKVKVQSVGY